MILGATDMIQGHIYENTGFAIPHLVMPPDDKPLIIPFGFPTSGKTLLVFRLISYLYTEIGYDVDISPFLWHHSDIHFLKYYEECCISQMDAVRKCEPTLIADVRLPYVYSVISRRNGARVCYFMDFTGDIFSRDSSVVWNKYFVSITAASNKKIWLFLLEKDAFGNQQKRDEYACAIKRMLNNISPKDKVIFVFNKADIYINKYVKEKHIDMKSFMKDINLQYPNLFDRYKSKGVAKFFKGEYNFNYTFFSSGIFTNTPHMRDVWSPGPDIYCENLWKKIKALL